jgi:hypothetical protein
MSNSLGNGYIGADVNFINDATQEALDLKSNLAGGNTFTGDQNLSNGNIVLANGSKLQGNEIVGNNELYMRTIGNSNIRLEPAGSGEITGTKDINLSAGKEYRVNGTNILTGYATTAYVDAEDVKKANLDGGNTFTGNQALNAGSFEIQASGGYNIKTPQIVGNDELYMRTIGNSNIRLEPAGTGEITGTKDINLSAGKAYKVNGVDILNNIPTTSNVVLLTGDQDVNGVKTFKSNIKADSNLLINTDAGQIKLGILADRQIERTASGISTNGTMNASKYNVNGTQIASGNLSNDTFLVKTNEAQTLSQKTIDATANTIQNLTNAEIASNAGIVYSKLNIADGALTIAKTSNLQSALDGKASDAVVVKVTDDQDVNGVKTFKDNVKVDNNLLINTDAGLIKFGSLGDRQIERTADGISTNGKMTATEYKIGANQITSSALSNDADLVKTTNIDQSIAGQKTFSNDVKVDSNLLINTDNGLIKFGSLGDFQFARIADGISTNGKINAVQYKVGGNPLTSSHLLDGATLVKESGFQTLTLKTINADNNTIQNLRNAEIASNAGIVYSKLNIADGDLTIAKTDTLQSALDDKADDNAVVKLTDAQTIQGAKTFSDKMIVNNETNLNGVFKHTFNASTNVGIQLDNNNVNQYALNATTLGYGWRWRGEATSGGDTDLFDVRTKKGGTSHKVFNVSNADIIRMIGNVRIDTTGTKLNLAGLPTSSAGLSTGDVYNDGGILKIA